MKRRIQKEDDKKVPSVPEKDETSDPHTNEKFPSSSKEQDLPYDDQPIFHYNQEENDEKKQEERCFERISNEEKFQTNQPKRVILEFSNDYFIPGKSVPKRKRKFRKKKPRKTVHRIKKKKTTTTIPNQRNESKKRMEDFMNFQVFFGENSLCLSKRNISTSLLDLTNLQNLKFPHAVSQSTCDFIKNLLLHGNTTMSTHKVEYFFEQYVIFKSLKMDIFWNEYVEHCKPYIASDTFGRLIKLLSLCLKTFENQSIRIEGERINEFFPIEDISNFHIFESVLEKKYSKNNLKIIFLDEMSCELMSILQTKFRKELYLSLFEAVFIQNLKITFIEFLASNIFLNKNGVIVPYKENRCELLNTNPRFRFQAILERCYKKHQDIINKKKLYTDMEIISEESKKVYHVHEEIVRKSDFFNRLLDFNGKDVEIDELSKKKKIVISNKATMMYDKELQAYLHYLYNNKICYINDKEIIKSFSFKNFVRMIYFSELSFDKGFKKQVLNVISSSFNSLEAFEKKEQFLDAITEIATLSATTRERLFSKTFTSVSDCLALLSGSVNKIHEFQKEKTEK